MTGANFANEEGGVERKVFGFAALLSYSRMCFVTFTKHSDMPMRIAPNRSVEGTSPDTALCPPLQSTRGFDVYPTAPPHVIICVACSSIS